MESSQNIINISTALLAAQKEMGAVVKDSNNPFFKSKYATLNAVREVVMGPLSNSGIVLLQPTMEFNGEMYVKTMLIHAETGEFLSSMTKVTVVKKDDAQSVGSGISYSRRYGLMSMLSLAAEDDDGNNAVGKKLTDTKENMDDKPKKPTFSRKAVEKSSSGDLI